MLSVNLMFPEMMSENCLMPFPSLNLRPLSFSRVLSCSLAEPTVRTLSNGVMQGLWLQKGKVGFGGAFGSALANMRCSFL